MNAFRVVENKSDHSQLVATLQDAVSEGAIVNFTQCGLRDIFVTTHTGQTIQMTWFTNLVTVRLPGIHVWVDRICLSNCMPSFRVALACSYRGVECLFIGEEY